MAGEATLSAWRAGLVLARASAGDTESARATLAELAADGFAAIDRDMFWLPALCVLAEAAAEAADVRVAAALAAELAPHADRNAQIGFAVLLGPVQLFVATAAAAAGQVDEAESRFRDAIDRSAALGMLTAEVRSRCGYGELLLARGGDGGTRQLEETLEIAERLGMAGCAGRAKEALGHGD